MDVHHLKRNPSYIHGILSEDGESLIALKPLKIYIPEHYQSANLANISDTITLVGIFGIVSDGQYAISIADAMVTTVPTSLTVVTSGNEKYYEFSYEKGDKIITNINLIRVNTLILVIYQEFISKANIPWYFTYNDISALFETSILHANANLRIDNAVIELMVSAISRQRQDKKSFFRHDPKLTNINIPAYIPLSSVAYQATNTFTKLAGGYFNEGMVSALVNPSGSNESVEMLLRQ